MRGITNWLYGGDSIMNGSNASVVGLSYRGLLNAKYSTTNNNHSVGGRGVWREIENFHTLTFTRSSTMIVVEAGLNDIRRSHTTQTINKIESEIKTIIKKAFGAAAVASGGSGVTRSGSFSAFNADAYGGAFNDTGGIGNNVASYQTTANATWSYTFTAPQNNTTAFVCFSATYPSIARGDAEVRIDGVLVETITDLDDRWDGVSDGDNDNQRGPATKFYFGLASGSHTIEVKATSTTAVVVDHFGYLDVPSNVGTMIVQEVPYVTDYSKPGLDQANDSYIDQINAIRKTWVDTFAALGYRIYYVKIMKEHGLLYDTSIGIDSDGVHPTDAGHRLIFNSYLKYLPYLGT